MKRQAISIELWKFWRRETSKAQIASILFIFLKSADALLKREIYKKPMKS